MIWDPYTFVVRPLVILALLMVGPTAGGVANQLPADLNPDELAQMTLWHNPEGPLVTQVGLPDLRGGDLDNLDDVWLIANPDEGATTAQVRFSQLNLKEGDRVTVMDRAGRIYQQFGYVPTCPDAQRCPIEWTVGVPGDVLLLHLETVDDHGPLSEIRGAEVTTADSLVLTPEPQPGYAVYDTYASTTQSAADNWSITYHVAYYLYLPAEIPIGEEFEAILDIVPLGPHGMSSERGYNGTWWRVGKPSSKDRDTGAVAFAFDDRAAYNSGPARWEQVRHTYPGERTVEPVIPQSDDLESYFLRRAGSLLGIAFQALADFAHLETWAAAIEFLGDAAYDLFDLGLLGGDPELPETWQVMDRDYDIVEVPFLPTGNMERLRFTLPLYFAEATDLPIHVLSRSRTLAAEALPEVVSETTFVANFSVPLAFAPAGQVGWQEVVPDDGIGAGTVWAVEVAPDGSLWVAAIDWEEEVATGVSRLWPDGRWTNYTSVDGLGGDFVADIAAGPDGMVWFATIDVEREVAAISRLAPDGRWDTFDLPIAPEDLLGEMLFFWDVEAASDGSVWTNILNEPGGDEGPSGVARLDPDGDWTTYTTEDGLAGTFVLDMAVGDDGSIWFTTANEDMEEGFGISRLGADGRWTAYSTEDGLANDFVYAIEKGTSGEMWFATFDMERERVTLSRLGPDGVWSRYPVPPGLAEDEDEWLIWSPTMGTDGSLWFGMLVDLDNDGGLGVGRLMPDGSWQAYTELDGLAGNTVWDIATDEDGTVWFGASTGLSRYGVMKPARRGIPSARYGTPSEAAIAFMEAATAQEAEWLLTTVSERLITESTELLPEMAASIEEEHGSGSQVYLDLWSEHLDDQREYLSEDYRIGSVDVYGDGATVEVVTGEGGLTLELVQEDGWKVDSVNE